MFSATAGCLRAGDEQQRKACLRSSVPIDVSAPAHQSINQYLIQPGGMPLATSEPGLAHRKAHPHSHAPRTVRALPGTPPPLLR